jgi:hypothetical protein
VKLKQTFSKVVIYITFQGEMFGDPWQGITLSNWSIKIRHLVPWETQLGKWHFQTWHI